MSRRCVALMAEKRNATVQLEQAVLAASLLRDFVAQKHITLALARRAFLAFLIASGRGSIADIDVRILTVACLCRVGCSSVSALCAASNTNVQSVNDVTHLLAVPVNLDASTLERIYDDMLSSCEVTSDLRSVLDERRSSVTQTNHVSSVHSPSNSVAALHSIHSQQQASGSSKSSHRRKSPTKRVRASPKPVDPSTPPKRMRFTSIGASGTAEPATPRTPIRETVRGGLQHGRFVKFVSSIGDKSELSRENVNPLDALALVASSTPRSFARIGRSGKAGDDTLAQDWISRLMASRGGNGGFVKTAKLSVLIPDNDWSVVCDRVRKSLSLYSSSQDEIELCPTKNEKVVCVYFSSLEAILETERVRGLKADDQESRFVQRLIRSEEFHLCLITCSLETIAAVHCQWDMSTINSALQAFDISAYAVTKGISSFARQLPSCPKSIVKHLMICEQRYIEAVVWKRDSDLISYLEDRSSSSNTSSLISVTGDTEKNKSVGSLPCATVNEDAASVNQKDGNQKSNSADADQRKTPGQTDESLTSEKVAGAMVQEKRGPSQYATDQLSESKSNTRYRLSPPSICVRELTLKMFYSKLLFLAEERMSELLAHLDMEFLEELVFTVIKHVVVTKWQLLVDRHLDQIILCAIYGVAKVRQHPLLFRSIINHYQQVSHLREPTFSPFLPDLFTNIKLKHGIKDDMHLPPRTGGESVIRGDIIKMYNIEFMPVMRELLLKMDPVRYDKMSVSTGTPGMRSTGGSLTDLTSLANSSSHGSMKLDGLAASIIRSPLRRVRRYSSPRRIGNVTVSPMSSSARAGLSSFHSPARTAMTPNTRLLYAFRESPSQQGAVSPHRVPATLSFTQPGERPASIRRMYAEAFSQRSRSDESDRRRSN